MLDICDSGYASLPRRGQIQGTPRVGAIMIATNSQAITAVSAIALVVGLLISVPPATSGRWTDGSNAFASPAPTLEVAPHTLMRGPMAALIANPLHPVRTYPSLTPTAAASGQNSTWLQWNVTNASQARQEAMMADDPADGGVLLFGGGSYQRVALNDTWLFQNGTWRELCSGTGAVPSCARSPPARFAAAMAYDASDHEVVLYGGEGANSSPLNDTWVFHNDSWTNVTHGSTPSTGGSTTHPMTYDPSEAGLLYVDDIVGGTATWRFSNGSWTKLVSGSQPSVEGALFYDSAARETILWNGQTWEFSKDAWTQLHPAASPPGNFPVAYDYDTGFGHGVLFSARSGYPINYTWFFSNGTWENATSAVGAAPPISALPAMAYDSTDGYSVLDLEVQLLDNANQTWLLENPLTVNVTRSGPVTDVGRAITFTVDASGGIQPFSLNLTSAPLGCTSPPHVSTVTRIVCLPSQPGSFLLGLNFSDELGTSVALAIPFDVNPQLTANATASPNPTTVGIPVGLDARTSGGTAPYAESWTLSGGTMSHGTSMNHVFTQPGAYAGLFLISDSVGASVSVNVTIIVHNGVSVDAVESANVTDVGLPVELSARAVGGTAPLAYAWTFGDGNSSRSMNSSYSYSDPGVFAPHVWANDSVGASANASLRITVHPAIVANATANASRPVKGMPVTFTAVAAGGTPPYSYAWAFGDGASATGSTASHAFVALGTHSVLLEVNDSVGGSISRHLSVDVLAAPVNATPLPAPGNASAGYPVYFVFGAAIAGLAAGGLAGLLIGKRKAKSPGTKGAEPDR